MPTTTAEFGWAAASRTAAIRAASPRTGATSIQRRCARHPVCRAIESHHRVIARKVRDGVAPRAALPASARCTHPTRTAVPVDVDPDPISVHLDVDTIAHDITPVHGRCS